MRKLSTLTLITFLLIFLFSCSDSKQADIITTAFPQYDFARQIAGDKLTVSLLTNPGQEIHKYEVTSKDRVAIRNSKLFIFTSFEIDQWIKDIDSLAGKSTLVLNLSEAYSGIHDHTHASLSTILEDPHDHDDHEDDIHYWVDPIIAIELIEAIYAKIVEIDPDNEVYYTANMERYTHEIHELHHILEDLIEDNNWHHRTLYFAGHNALGLFALRYEIDIVSIYTDFKPEQDTLSTEMIQFMNRIKSSGTNYLMIEELIEPLVALRIKQSLANEGYPLTLLELHAYHNVTKADFDAGISYADIFARNIENIRIAFGG